MNYNIINCSLCLEDFEPTCYNEAANMLCSACYSRLKAKDKPVSLETPNTTTRELAIAYELNKQGGKQMANDTDSWDNYISGTFLKAIDVNSDQDAFICTEVAESDREGVKQIRLTLERNAKEYELDLNKTNAKKLKELGLASPKATIGKKLFFKKALVRNPKTNQEVEGLRIYRIE